MDVTLANPVRSERKQPQRVVYGLSSLPLIIGVCVLYLVWLGLSWPPTFYSQTGKNHKNKKRRPRLT